MRLFEVNLSALHTKQDTCANSVDPDETANSVDPDEPSHQDPHCSPFRFDF